MFRLEMKTEGAAFLEGNKGLAEQSKTGPY
jgi:hypothetical protein